MDDVVSFLPIGGVGDVTRNMYLYEYENQILIVDCGLGFADETMLGVNLLLPDISYVLQNQKKVVGMVLTHGHEDHIGALPFVLPQFSVTFPIFGSSLTAAFANAKLKEFGISSSVDTLDFNKKITIGPFSLSLIRVTHSVPDTANIHIQTKVGNFFHASDFKFDLTPFDGKKTDLQAIAKAGEGGILCLMSDCLRSEQEGHTGSEYPLTAHIETEMGACKGKFIFTTYSSNISRLNQVIQTANKQGRYICFIGRSLLKAKEIALRLGIMHIQKGLEIEIDQLKKYSDKQLVLLVAGSQGQENSALSRIANNDFKDVSISANDSVVFSSDPIPGNEISVHSLIDTIAKKGAKVVYSQTSKGFHVSGHAAANDLMLMMQLINPSFVLPIGGTYRHMVAYKKLAMHQGIGENHIMLLEDGREVLFDTQHARLGKKVPIKNIYVDEISGEEIEHYILRDRQKISKEGVVVVMVEVDSETGQIIHEPNVTIRGFSKDETTHIAKGISQLQKELNGQNSKVTDWTYIRKKIGEVAERHIFKTIHRRPLVLPIVIEV